MLVLLAGLLAAGCSSARSADEDPVDEGALKAANDEWTELSSTFERHLAAGANANDLHVQTMGAARKEANLLGVDLCGVVKRFPQWVDRDAPRPYTFIGGSVDLSAVGSGSLAVEVAWDLYRNQMALFRGHSLGGSNGAGLSASLYGGLAFQNTKHARRLDALADDVLNAWGGANYSIGVSTEVAPFISLGAEVFADPQFLMEGVTLRVSAGIDFLPDNLPATLERALAVEVSVSKSSMDPSDALTKYASEWLAAGPLHVPHYLARAKYDDVEHPYLQFEPVTASVAGEHGRESLATSQSLIRVNPALAAIAGPIALAIGVLRDLEATHHVPAAKICP